MNKGGSPLSEWVVQMMEFAGEFFFFFQSTFEVNEMFCLLYRFVIFNNEKPALKITHGQQSLTIVQTFVTTEKPCQTITMTITTNI